ncbi:PQQ-dependent sugar dehydrogenase [Microcoleus sp. FACHB-53]|nr:PQQ-dependent sugar dehydrogenase [Microcoleus sp. FACHB-53]
MKKSSRLKRSTFAYWICSVFFSVIAFASISSNQITKNPIPSPIEKSKLSVGLEEVVKIPDSGSDKDENKAARLNLLIPPGDGSGRLFVNDMRGKLYVIVDRTATIYMDVKSIVGKGFHDESGQQGFSYFVFHPEFAKNGIFYTVTSEKRDTGTPDFPVSKPIFNNKGQSIASSHHDVIREWKATNPSTNTFSGTMREIIRIEEPYPDHNTGQLAFNPNAKPGDADYGMLYIAVADGGSDGFPVSDTDPLDNGQDLGTPLGKILRIKPLGNNSTNGKYGIPADNPFVDDSDPKKLDEIWAYGLRNPHRFSWDTGGDGKMLIVDTGQAFIEEVNLGKKGANYGWGEREGTWVVDENNENVVYELPENDRDFNYTYPVAQYGHDIPPGVTEFYGIAIAGGFVYRGTAIPELVGQYVFADFGSDGRFFHVPVDELADGKQAKIKELRLFDGKKERSFLEMVGKKRTDVRFGIDEAGELYVTSKQDGKVRKIVP